MSQSSKLDADVPNVPLFLIKSIRDEYIVRHDKMVLSLAKNLENTGMSRESLDRASPRHHHRCLQKIR